MNHTQAWCWHAPGEPTQLTLADLPLAPLTPDEVLVANRVIAFNPVDWKLIEYGHSNWQDGQVPGVDGMGTIVALGANVSHLRLGARVAITPTCATTAALPATLEYRPAPCCRCPMP
ncbi:alcohol dehydrogenase catalytic domain-containing protein [Aeromonas veronii]